MNALQPILHPDPSPAVRLERAVGRAVLAVHSDGGRTRLERLYQGGAAKIRLPRVAPDSALEAVLLNTAGGMTGGDRFRCDVMVRENARALVTTQAAERVYRRSGGVAEVANHLEVAAGARLDWLPQETILFDRSGLSRRLVTDIDPAGTLLAVESFVLGRAAMGEAVRLTSLIDRWRIRRGGRLIFADGVRIEGDATAILSRGATGGGATAFATLVLVAPDAGRFLDIARAALAPYGNAAGASAWNGILVVRMVAANGQVLRAGLIDLVEGLRGRPMPRVWQC